MCKVELIDSVAYRKELEAEKNCCERTADLLMGIEIAIADLGDMPTIDPIHAAGGCYCFECRYFEDGHCIIRKDNLGRRLTAGLHDFCSDGRIKK